MLDFLENKLKAKAYIFTLYWKIKSHRNYFTETIKSKSFSHWARYIEMQEWFLKKSERKTMALTFMKGQERGRH